MATEPLRVARPEDVGLLTTMISEFYAEAGYPLDEARVQEAFTRLCSDAGLGRLWLILEEGAPVGYVAVTFGFSLEYYGRDAFIDDLYVREAYRGRRLGTRVLEVVERECRELGVRALHLEVERSNRSAQGLYRNRGFRDNERQLLSKRLEPGP